MDRAAVTGPGKMIALFEEPLLPGWVYPCTLEDLRQQLSELPPDDLEGLHAVGLVPATRKDCSANARYWWGGKPTIRVYSYRASLTYRQPAGVKLVHVRHGLAVELAFGMRVEQIGRRWVCR